MRRSLRNRSRLAALHAFHIGSEVREDSGEGYRNGIVEEINHEDDDVIVRFEDGEISIFDYGDVLDMIIFYNDYAADFNARNEQHMQRLLNENEAAEEEQEQVVGPLILEPAAEEEQEQEQVVAPLILLPAAEEEQEQVIAPLILEPAAEEEQEQVVAPLILPPAPVTTPLFATPTVARREEARNIEGPYRENEAAEEEQVVAPLFLVPAAEEEQEQVVAPLILPPAPVTTPLFATRREEARNIEGPYRENFDETSVDATPLNGSYDTPNRSHYLHSFDDISPFTRNFDNLFIDEVCECGLPKPCLICNPKWRV